MSENEFSHTGHCICKGVSFGIKEKLNVRVDCHCQQCRNFTGHYAVLFLIPNSQQNLVITNDKELKWFQEEGKGAIRGFCGKCGCSLFQKGVNGNYFLVMAGCFDKTDDLPKEATRTAYLQEKGQYY